MYNRLVIAPGNNLALGSDGGVLLLGPPGRAPGAMTLTDLQNRTWHLLREDGPDNGYPAPVSGDFPIQVVTRDLNIGFADFISQTGIAPGLVERQSTLPVFPVLDHPVPPDLQSLTALEYTQAGQQPYTMFGLSFSEWTRTFGAVQPTGPSGNPYYYRTPFAGYIRLFPQPTIGNAVGPGVGVVSINGSPTVGQKVTVTVANPGFPPVTSAPYTVLNTDTTSTIAVAVAGLVNLTSAVIGPNAFIQPAITVQNTITITAIVSPGTNITYSAMSTGVGATVLPTAASPLSPNGDTMTWYYTSAGNLLINPGDSPQMPPQFHMALVYRVLQDYWARKQDFSQAKLYEQRFNASVARGKSFTFDSDRSTQPTIAGIDDDDYGLTWIG